jgi:hypothetical protein
MTIFEVFLVKNHDFTPKNHIFSNFRGVRPPESAPAVEKGKGLSFSSEWFSLIAKLKYYLGWSSSTNLVISFQALSRPRVFWKFKI